METIREDSLGYGMAPPPFIGHGVVAAAGDDDENKGPYAHLEAMNAARLVPILYPTYVGEEQRSRKFLIGPAEAEELLTYNTHNRVIRPSKLSKFKRDVVARKWRDTGIPLIIHVPLDGSDCTMDDGGHRTRLPILTGIAIPFTISYVYGGRVHAVVDTGTPRTVGDIGDFDLHFAHLPERERKVAVTAVSILNLWINKGKTLYDHATLRERFEESLKQQSEIEWATSVLSAYKEENGKLLPQGFVAGLIAMHRANPTHADIFADSLITGAGLDIEDPILALFKEVHTGIALRAAYARRKQARSYESIFNYGYTIRAWNAYMSGRALKRLSNDFSVLQPRGEEKGLPAPVTVYHAERNSASIDSTEGGEVLAAQSPSVSPIVPKLGTVFATQQGLDAHNAEMNAAAY